MSDKQEIETCYFDPGYAFPTDFPDIICAKALNEVIHYIRTDKAKERERLLLVAHALLIMDNPGPIDYENIYEAAGIEELK